MPRKALGQAVFSRIKELVLSTHFKPGQRLLDRDLARLLGVSRTPVREALVRLYQDGLLVAKDGKGYFVVDIEDGRQIADLYDLREVLEIHAVRMATERAQPRDLTELAEVLSRLETYRAVPEKRGEEIRDGLLVHEIIARASGNAMLHEMLVRLLNRMRFFIWIETLYEDTEAAEQTRREHGAFLELIRERRADEAEALMRAHIRTARDHILRIEKLREAFYPPVDLSPITDVSLQTIPEGGRSSLRGTPGRRVTATKRLTSVTGRRSGSVGGAVPGSSSGERSER